MSVTIKKVRNLILAAQNAESWLSQTVPGTQQHELGVALKTALEAFAKPERSGPPRRLHMNVYGNTSGYEGRKKVIDFGADEYDAKEWLADPVKYAADKADRLSNSNVKVREIPKEPKQ